MKKLHDYLDCKWIRITCTDSSEFEGFPVTVDYSDETESGEDEITLENRKWNGPQYLGIKESEIQKIEVIR